MSGLPVASLEHYLQVQVHVAARGSYATYMYLQLYMYLDEMVNLWQKQVSLSSAFFIVTS